MMNQRIQELAEQAEIKFESHPQHQGVDTAVIIPTDLEKFALLIVRECARVAIEKQTENDVLNIVSKNPAKDFAYALVEHFGVE